MQHLLRRRFSDASLRWLGASVLVVIASAPPGAQTASSSDLRVSVTVARSCTVSTVTATPATPAPDSPVSVKCGEGATPAAPQVSVVDQPAAREEEGGDSQPTPSPDTRITLVVVNF